MKLKPFLLGIAMMSPLLSLSYSIQAEPSPSKFFSLAEIQDAKKAPLQTLAYTKATDEVALAYRAYLPAQAKAVLVFYHGGGAHSGLSYNHIGVGLQDNFNIAVYTPDIRGHGGSGGERGDAPSSEQVWSDINQIIKVAQTKFPDLPVYIGGHSSGAGLVLNYSSWDESMAVDGYVFLAPYFGFRSETNYDEGSEKSVQFSTVNTSDFVINAMSGGLFKGHAKAVQFNYPDSLLKKNPEIVSYNTVNMANAMTPHSPDTQVSELQNFGVWIGDKDEAFDPIKVIAFVKEHSAKEANKEVATVDNVNHFSIMLNAYTYLGPWLLQK